MLWKKFKMMKENMCMDQDIVLPASKYQVLSDIRARGVFGNGMANHAAETQDGIDNHTIYWIRLLVEIFCTLRHHIA
ncbi:hypothetical protein AMELA_G00136000 [Ameiurus melas]|uniref:Uncharacterized protein n=1 Tax=Ameiurus melas TaxID=219545 RepID=A0A7J6ALW8_AMEME|nr:hypothetical protein AMELA_G00136000 [Ameiurus melas]